MPQSTLSKGIWTIWSLKLFHDVLFPLQVYDQLNSLAQKNPWFVQSLQSIMSSAALHEGGLPAQLPQVQVRGDAPGATTTATSGADPAQAALILLLAGEADSSGRSRC